MTTIYDCQDGTTMNTKQLMLMILITFLYTVTAWGQDEMTVTTEINLSTQGLYQDDVIIYIGNIGSKKHEFELQDLTAFKTLMQIVAGASNEICKSLDSETIELKGLDKISIDSLGTTRIIGDNELYDLNEFQTCANAGSAPPDPITSTTSLTIPTNNVMGITLRMTGSKFQVDILNSIDIAHDTFGKTMAIINSLMTCWNIASTLVSFPEYYQKTRDMPTDTSIHDNIAKWDSGKWKTEDLLLSFVDTKRSRPSAGTVLKQMQNDCNTARFAVGTFHTTVDDWTAVEHEPSKPTMAYENNPSCVIQLLNESSSPSRDVITSLTVSIRSSDSLDGTGRLTVCSGSNNLYEQPYKPTTNSSYWLMLDPLCQTPEPTTKETK